MLRFGFSWFGLDQSVALNCCCSWFAIVVFASGCFGLRNMFGQIEQAVTPILCGAIGSAFGCYYDYLYVSQATGRFLVRSQAEEDCVFVFFYHSRPLGYLLPGGVLHFSMFDFFSLFCLGCS